VTTELVRGGERLLASVTLVRAVRSMQSSQVTAQVVLARKGSVAILAFVRALTRVAVNVAVEVVLTWEGTTASFKGTSEHLLGRTRRPGSRRDG
jgi:hypothetical protein